jgi:hypothetical protein
MSANHPLFNPKDILITSGLSLAYVLLSTLLIGFKTDQIALVVIFNFFFYVSVVTRKFIIGFSVFIIFWILYDYLKAFPNYLYKDVSIEELYQLELNWFGIDIDGNRITPNEYWLTNRIVFLDVMSGLFYLLWVPVPMAFSVFLFIKGRKRQFLYFLMTFLLVNLLGFVGYYLYPAAPPWYIQYYGTGFIRDTLSNPAQLIHFDEFFGVPVFQTIYSKGSNVFAAMPSLHSAYPLIVLYYGIKNRLGTVANIFFVVVVFGIWFAAVYTSHHYILDVLAGIVTAALGIVLFNWLKERRPIRNLVDAMMKKID